MDGKTDIEGTAAMAKMGVRTLQRCLNQEGLSYRDLLGLVRSERAKALLRETDLPVTEVAMTLGCSPASYRHHARCQA